MRRALLLGISFGLAACGPELDTATTAQPVLVGLTGPTVTLPIWTSANPNDIDPDNSMFFRAACPAGTAVAGLLAGRDGSFSPLHSWAASLGLGCTTIDFDGASYSSVAIVASPIAFIAPGSAPFEAATLPFPNLARGLDTRINLQGRHVRSMRVQGWAYTAGGPSNPFRQTRLLPTHNFALTMPVNPFGDCTAVDPLAVMTGVSGRADVRSGRVGRIRQLDIECRRLLLPLSFDPTPFGGLDGP